MKGMMIALFALFLLPVALAQPITPGACSTGTFFAVQISFEPNVTSAPAGTLVIENNCTGTEVAWQEPVNLTLGTILPSEMQVTATSVYVDSAARPDLNQPATLTFTNLPFAVQPDILRDGVTCTNCTNVTYDAATASVSFNVPGFSNYSLQGLKEFTVQSDPKPELYTKTYQTIDLGNSHRNEEFKCLVQLYGRNDVGQWILMQTNPERKVAAKLLGNPDTNNPESLGYFKTENGLANVYFDGSKVAGYENYEYVVQCASNSTKLTYEENIDTRYRAAGRNLQGRFLWFNDGNALKMVLIVVGSIIVIWVVLLWVRSLRWR